MEKIVRSICYLTKDPNEETIAALRNITERLTKHGFTVQTQRICASGDSIGELSRRINDKAILLSVGALSLDEARKQLKDFFACENSFFNIDICGVMYPCLEDFELAEEYERGNFSIERNIFLFLHCGLGIDTYPIGTNEKPERVGDILKLIQGLSNKYNKAFSARFVSDGKAKIGEKTDFQNQYLKDVVVWRL